MNTCIDKSLLDEICTIKTPENNLIGRITEINSETFSVITISSSYDLIDLNKPIEIKIETINNEIYNINTTCESSEELDKSLILHLKPISQSHNKNKRKFKRLDIKLNYDDNIVIKLQQFPPLDTTYWKKGEIVDISSGGIRVKEDEFLSIGQLIELELAIPFYDNNIYIISRVVNKTKVNDTFIMSIQFLNISDKNRLTLEQYIDNIIDQYKNKN